MRITQDTVDRMSWWVVFIVLLLNIAIFVKLTIDDAQKFRILQDNQNTIICIIKAPEGIALETYAQKIQFVDSCVNKYRTE